MISINLPVDLIEDIKDIVYWNPSNTISSFAEEALKYYIDHSSFVRQKRNGNIKRGRPLS